MPQVASHSSPKLSTATNTLGLIGLVLSILGFVTLITAPIGLIVSLFGLRHHPKGLAITGAVLGMAGTAYAFLVVLFFGAACVAFSLTTDNVGQHNAAVFAASDLLDRWPDEVRVKGPTIPPFQTSYAATAQATYIDDEGVERVVTFTATYNKVNGIWKANNARLDTDTREWEADGYHDADFPIGIESAR